MQRYGAVINPLREHLVGKVSTPLCILLGTVGIVFLVACANLANLFMVRAESRRRDFAVRRADRSGHVSTVMVCGEPLVYDMRRLRPETYSAYALLHRTAGPV
jgi:hypothetical protein